MNEKTLRLLEFAVIRSRVAERCLSEEAAAHLAEAEVLIDAAAIAELKATVTELVTLATSGAAEPRSNLPTVGELLPRLGKEGSSLELDEAYALGLFVEGGSAIKAWLSGEGAGERLKAAAAAFPDCSSVSKEVFRVLDRDGSLRDLPEFREIKRRIQGLRRDLEAVTARYFGDDETRRMLQSDVPSQRDGRLVLAVKANYRGRVKGIVHEVSATGQTIFVEPEDVVEKNNDILIEERRLAAEVARVLREMTARIGEKKTELEELRRRVLHMDGLRARARYSLDSRGIFALDGSDVAVPPGEDQPYPAGRLNLVRARHPLLGLKAVPIDLSMDAATRVVIVTGPNTGGKTVALKTVGLFALMNQFGLAIPADEGTILPVFDGVYADIGDEQSISQSLSTFSAHMTNMASIASAATERSLVLLDELGSGTDPEEGSAIAMSILDHFIGVRSRLLSTTHHGILKNYGYTKAGVQNASVDFDGKTLSPTYRILMGVPGESRALDIASRNGLQTEIVDRARTYLDEERADVSELIRGLKSKHRELEAAERDQKDEERKLREERRKTDLKELRLRQKEVELREQGVGSLKRLLGESRKTLENLVRELREGEMTRDKTLKVKDFLAELERTVNEESEKFEKDAENLGEAEREARAAAAAEAELADTDRRSAAPRGSSRKTKATPQDVVPTEISPGVEVLAGPSRRRGIVLRSAKKGSWVVEIGALKMTLSERELVPVASARKDIRVEIAQADLSSTANAQMELNLRGMRLEEALDALRRQLDAAALSGLYEFSVIHGKGDGILQRGVHDYLKSQSVVADYYFSRPEDGGYGKTMVSLKR